MPPSARNAGFSFASASAVLSGRKPSSRATVFAFLRTRRLVTTRVRVEAPGYTDVRLDVTVVRDDRSPASREEVLNAIRRYEGAIILVTHDEGAVEALEPDRVLILPMTSRVTASSICAGWMLFPELPGYGR